MIGLVSDIKEKYPLPSLEDYNGAAVALHRLEDTYQIEPQNIRLGNLSSQFPSRPLTGTRFDHHSRLPNNISYQ